MASQSPTTPQEPIDIERRQTRATTTAILEASVPKKRSYQLVATDRISNADKLQGVLDAMLSYNMTFKQFILAWAGHKSCPNVQIKHEKYRHVQSRRTAIEEAMRELYSAGVCGSETLTTGIMAIVGKEFDYLIDNSKYFGEMDINAHDYAYLETFDFERAFTDVEEHAPTWHQLLTKVLEPAREYTPATRRHTTKRIYQITAVACHSRSRNNSSYFLGVADVYLHHLGVKRRVIDTLSALGICHGYRHGIRITNKLADEAEVRSCAPTATTPDLIQRMYCTVFNCGAPYVYVMLTLVVYRVSSHA